MSASQWLGGRRTLLANPQMRLYCFPYAGGSASIFDGWQNALPHGTELRAIQLPGRGTRFNEPALTCWSGLTEAIAAMVADDPLPSVFFGHSMGALVAFEVARALHAKGRRTPALLIASGCSAPRARPESRIRQSMSDAELIQELESYCGTPAEILEHKELMALLLPMLRADFALVEDYVYRPSPPLACPIVALAGQQDEITADQIAAWAQETGGGFDEVWFEGDHFFLNSERDQVLQTIAARLTGLSAAAPARLFA
jgi:medium-chain acyl-[acyl-carrier-protein] hydrolase